MKLTVKKLKENLDRLAEIVYKRVESVIIMLENAVMTEKDPLVYIQAKCLQDGKFKWWWEVFKSPIRTDNVNEFDKESIKEMLELSIEEDFEDYEEDDELEILSIETRIEYSDEVSEESKEFIIKKGERNDI